MQLRDEQAVEKELIEYIEFIGHEIAARTSRRDAIESQKSTLFSFDSQMEVLDNNIHTLISEISQLKAEIGDIFNKLVHADGSVGLKTSTEHQQMFTSFPRDTIEKDVNAALALPLERMHDIKSGKLLHPVYEKLYAILNVPKHKDATYLVTTLQKHMDETAKMKQKVIEIESVIGAMEDSLKESHNIENLQDVLHRVKAVEHGEMILGQDLNVAIEQMMQAVDSHTLTNELLDDWKNIDKEPGYKGEEETG
eukprot:m.38160 g.38160  ORF g.38160 m.38160 type:complete len:252 (+) comp6783_c0_seq3:923-1678(+)